MQSVVSVILHPNQRLLDRDLSWLQFNERVLQEAQDPTNPLLERLRFLGITAGNLDEFFMIRFASRTREVDALQKKADEEYQQALWVREELLRGTRRFIKRQSTTFDELTEKLSSAKIVVHNSVPTEGRIQKLAKELFYSYLLPAIPAPLYFDSSSLQQIKNLQCAFVFQGRAILALPKSLPAIVKQRDGRGVLHCFFTEQLVRTFLAGAIGEQVPPVVFRVTRDADVTLELTSSDPESIPAIVRKRVDSRESRAVVRLQTALPIRAAVLEECLKQLELEPQEIFFVEHPLQLHGLISLVGDVEKEDGLDEKQRKGKLLYPKFRGCLPPPFNSPGSILKGIAKRDYILHHPYDSFEAYVNFIREAVQDTSVRSIQQTVYRIDTLSEVAALLREGAKRGKRVRVVIEPRARFDEIHNVQLAEEFHKAGVEVVFSAGPLKMHAKIATVTREQSGRQEVFTHLSTGNYNAKTARQYEDLALLTADPTIGADGLAFFDTLAAGAFPARMDRLVLAPAGLHRKIISLIRTEIRAAEAGKKARIFAKVNALVDSKIVEALYQASAAGVHVDLMVRGACSLIPGINDLSERIKVFSIVDRFLEHSRMYYFESQGVMYLSSADWMPRNFFSRFEIAFPVNDPRILSYLVNVVIPTYLNDRSKARVLTKQGSWRRRKSRSADSANAQQIFTQLSESLYKGSPLDEEALPR